MTTPATTVCSSLAGYLTARNVPHGYLAMRERFNRSGKWVHETIRWATTGDTYRMNGRKTLAWAAATEGNRDLGDRRHTPRPERPVAGKTEIPDQTYLAYTTREFFVLDIDNQDAFETLYPDLAKKLAADCPHYLSRNKRYPHYLVAVREFPKSRYGAKGLRNLHKLRGGAGELLTGQGTWVRPDDATGPLINGDKPPMALTFADLQLADPAPAKKKKKASPKKPAVKRSAVETTQQVEEEYEMVADATGDVPTVDAMAELLRIIDAKRYLRPRDSWLKIGTALRKGYGDRDGFALFDRASQRAPDKYPGEIECRRQFETMKTDAGVGIGTIVYYAQQSDAEAVEAWRERHRKRPTVSPAAADWVDRICEKRGIPRAVLNFALDNGYENLFGEDWGMARIYCMLAGDDTKFCDEAGDGSAFIWCDETRLWRFWNAAFVKVHIQRRCLPVALAAVDCIDHEISMLCREQKRPGLEKDYKERLDRQIKTLYKTKGKLTVGPVSRCRRTSYAKGIAEQVQFTCYDRDFATTINKSPDELPTRGGGVLDLRTGKTRRRTRDDLWSFELSVSCDGETSEADARDALRLFRSVCCDRDEDVEYLQQVLGYTMTGRTTERHYYVLHGHGRNGKTTVMSALKEILGEFYAQLSDAVFLDQGGRGSATPELMCLLTARLGVLSETKQGAALDPKRVKELTGNDPISGRHLYKSQITFKPDAKYILLTNHLPTFDARDQAMTDRIRLVPFDARFEATPENQAFVERFQEQGPLDAVFRLLVQGAMEYYKNGRVIDPPQRAKAAMRDYTGELDILGQFLGECDLTPDEETGKPRRWKRSDCYAAFQAFAQREGLETTRDCPLLNRRKFYAGLAKAGYEAKTTKGVRYVVGIGPSTAGAGDEE